MLMYQLEKHEQVTKRISHLTTSIRNWQNANATENDPAAEDALDAFMSSLNSFTLTKSDITKMKLELQGLRKEEADLIKLLNLTRPANLPTLSCRYTTDRTVAHVVPETPSETTAIGGSMFHSRRKKVRKMRVSFQSRVPAMPFMMFNNIMRHYIEKRRNV